MDEIITEKLKYLIKTRDSAPTSRDITDKSFYNAPQ